ncbi:MAG: RNA polymerase sigma factor [Gammaproteobacteria bacterium]
MHESASLPKSCDKYVGEDVNYLGDLHLVQAALAGEERAYNGLFNRYSKRIRSICLQYCSGDYALANDLCQETFISAFNKLGSLKDHGLFFTWLREIARNKCISYARKQITLDKVIGDYALIKKTIEANDQQWTDDEIELVEDLINKMKDNEMAETTHLFYFEGKRTNEIAEIQGISQTLVTTRLSRFRKIIRKRIALEILKLREDKE